MQSRLTLVAVLACGAVFAGGDAVIQNGPGLESFASAPPGRPLRLLFLHHSVGAQWLASAGAHPNGGGLKDALTAAGYEVRSATYGSQLGQRTDLFDWLPKFRDRMDAVLATARQDERHPEGRSNDIVMFKSCYPNSRFAGEGVAPGSASGPALTLWNAKATMLALREVFSQRPAVLFVYVTAPPIASAPRPAWKRAADQVRSTLLRVATPEAGAVEARAFNDWLQAPDGWLAGYPGRNIVVFDFHDVLTAHGRSTFLAYPTGGGTDSHPSSEGNRLATHELVPFLNRAVRRAGLVR